MDRLQNYMFFENLEQISRDINKLMSLDKEKIDAIISNGHDWVGEHITTAKDDIEEITNFLLSNAQEDKPYGEEIDENGIIRRTFSENVNESELEWHRDKEDRIVLPINENDWSIQFDNELPKKLNVNEEFFIPKETFHRVIKGSTSLVVEVIETEFEEDEYELIEVYETYEVIEEGKKKKKKKKKNKKSETKKNACYYKVKGRYEVWPSAYASGALTKCRNVGAANWGNSTDESELDEAKKRKLTAKPSSEKNLGDWFARKGGGWVDCNTCRKDSKTGRKKCKPCGRKEGEDRAKYPACRPTPSACDTKGKGEKWGKKSKKNENLDNSEKNPIFEENFDMRDIILHNLHETTQPAPVRENPVVVPEREKSPSPRRRRIWETKPSVRPNPKMEEDNDIE